MAQQQARNNMITQQVRAWGVLDDEILKLLDTIAREDFVPQAYKSLAYTDFAVPIGDGQVMLPPKEIGRLLQAVSILPTETILEIGTGTGYLTALLAKQANHVYTVDIDPEKTELAKKNLAPFDFDNITYITGDATKGWSQQAPYDVIISTGSYPKLPNALKQQLNVDGRIFSIIGNNPTMQAMLITQKADNDWQEEVLYETSAPRLFNLYEEEKFSF